MVGHFLALLLLSVLHHCLQFGNEHIWPGKSRHCTRVGEGHCPICAAWGRRAASSICMRMIDTSQTIPLALIGCVDPGAVDSCKSNYSHWVEPQTVDFYTADLYLVLLRDYNDNFSKYNYIYIFADYSFNKDQTALFSNWEMLFKYGCLIYIFWDAF